MKFPDIVLLRFIVSTLISVTVGFSYHSMGVIGDKEVYQNTLTPSQGLRMGGDTPLVDILAVINDYRSGFDTPTFPELSHGRPFHVVFSWT